MIKAFFWIWLCWAGAEPLNVPKLNWRGALSCGPNALYIYLTANGLTPSLSEIHEAVPVTHSGASFHSLQTAAEKFGVLSSVIKARPDQLAEYDMPIIVLFEGVGGNPGHYFILAGIKDGSYDLMDPISTLTTTVPAADFTRNWSGYAMVRKNSITRYAIWILVAFLFALVIKQAFHGSRVFSFRSLVVLAYGFPLIFHGQAAAQTTQQSLAPLIRLDVAAPRFDALVAKFQITPSMPVPTALHIARFREATNNPDSAAFLQALLSHDAFTKFYKPTNSAPFLVSTKHGCRFSETTWSPTKEEAKTREAHKGQALAVLGELSTPATTPIITSTGKGELWDVVRDLMANFSMEEEPFWNLSALSFYLPPQKSWRNKYGELFSFDSCAQALLKSQEGKSGPCGGAHSLIVLTHLLRKNRLSPILNPSTAADVQRCLVQAKNQLERSQQRDGSWKKDWSGVSDKITLVPPRSDPIWITGHLMEWQVFAEPEYRLGRKQLNNAANFLLEELEHVPLDALLSEPCIFTHGIYAIHHSMRVGERDQN